MLNQWINISCNIYWALALERKCVSTLSLHKSAHIIMTGSYEIGMLLTQFYKQGLWNTKKWAFLRPHVWWEAEWASNPGRTNWFQDFSLWVPLGFCVWSLPFTSSKNLGKPLSYLSFSFLIYKRIAPLTSQCYMPTYVICWLRQQYNSASMFIHE